MLSRKNEKKILVTGGCGFIGTNFCEYAIKTRGWKVVAFDNLMRANVQGNLKYLDSLSGFEFLKGDVRDPLSLGRIPVKEMDGVVHLAANPGIPKSIKQPLFDFETNARGTLNVLEWARKGNLPVIHASTNKVYSDEVNRYVKQENGRYMLVKPWRHGIGESFPVDSSGLCPHSPYGCSKYAGDLYCQEYFHTFGLPTVVNRMSCIAGEWQRGTEEQGWVQQFAKMILTEQPITIFGDGRQTRDVLYVQDLAELFCREIEEIQDTAGKVFNVGGGEDNIISLLECISLLEKGANRLASLRYKDWRMADHRAFYSCLDRVSQIWRPKLKVESTLQKVLGWTSKGL